jgi:unsaturated chondroitin disaccharide hydrolase
MIVTEILYKAAAFTGNSEYADIATTHARTTARTHVRDDGSTYHVVDFDPETGEIRGKHTAQGYTAESCWSRGQAWGIYGFATTWRETGDPLFRDMAMKLADYFIENLPDDYIPYSDFNAPNIPTESRDTSAAALAASGMLELASLLEDTELQSRYRGAALNILHSLCSEPYLTKGYDSAGILRHATGKWRPEVIENVSLIFGDYYFVEALLRYRGVLDMPSEKG